MVPTPTTRYTPLSDIQEARSNHAYLTRLTARTHIRPLIRALSHTETGAAVWAALDAIPSLCDEAEQLRELLATLQLDHANLIAAARATIAADAEGEIDPLYYLRDELPAHAAHAQIVQDGGEG